MTLELMMMLKSVIGSHDGPGQLLITDTINGPVQIKTLDKKPVTMIMMGVRLQNIIDKEFVQLETIRDNLYSLLKRTRNDNYQERYINNELDLIELIMTSRINICFDQIKQTAVITPEGLYQANSTIIVNQYHELDNPFIE